MNLLLYTLLYVIYAALFLLLIYRWKFFDISGVNKGHLAGFFLLKAAAGIGLTLVYTYYYTDPGKADIYRFFNDSKVISSLLFTHPAAWLKIITGIGTLDPGTFIYLHDTQYFTHPAGDMVTSYAFTTRIISLLNFFSGSNIYIDTLLLNCILFIGITVLFKTLSRYFDELPQILYLPLYLLPSFVFWSSGLLKEGFMFVGISFYLSGFLTAREERSFLKLCLLVIGVAIVGMTKIYVAATLLTCSFFLPVKATGRPAKIAWTGRITLLLVAGFVAYNYVGDRFCEKVIDKRNEFVALAVAENSRSNLETTPLTADCQHLITLVPSALVNAVLRPFVWNAGNLFEILFAIENLVFLVVVILLPVFYFKMPKGEKLWMAMFCFSFALFNYLGIGITVPVVGAIVHYRIVATPFLLLAALLVIDLDKLKGNLRSKL